MENFHKLSGLIVHMFLLHMLLHTANYLPNHIKNILSDFSEIRNLFILYNSNIYDYNQRVVKE